MQREYPYALPIFPLRRFYLKNKYILELEGSDEEWVEAENHVAATMMARTLWKPWFTGFSHERYVDPQTGKEVRDDYTIEAALQTLSKQLEQQYQEAMAEKKEKKQEAKGQR